MNDKLAAIFDLEGRVAVITGGLGLLGRRHAEVVAGAGGIPVLIDLPVLTLPEAGSERTLGSRAAFSGRISPVSTRWRAFSSKGPSRYGRVDILINNASNNPKMEAGSGTEWSRLENFPLAQWDRDLAVGLTGAFLCSRVVGWGDGPEEARGHRQCRFGSRPDRSRSENLPGGGCAGRCRTARKPLTYSVVKAGLLGLTRYLATDRYIKASG